MKRNVKRHAVVQPQDQSTRLIPLTLGQNMTVDALDYDDLMRWNWQSRWEPTAQKFYVVRSRVDEEDGPGARHIPVQRQILTRINAPRIPRVDHINGDTLDNRRCNLRLSTASQNGGNRCKLNKNNRSGYHGVHLDKWTGRWRALIKVDRKKICLGRFDDREGAARAYNAAAIKYFGEFATLNKV